jgi:hypothetical protein
VAGGLGAASDPSTFSELTADAMRAHADYSADAISAVRTERTARPGPLGRVSARQGDLEPVSGFEPLTVRLQGASGRPRVSLIVALYAV